MPSTPRPRRRPARAHSLVEVVAAVALMASTLVPTLELVRDAMQQSVTMDRLQLLALYGVSQMERRLAVVAYEWTSETVEGDFAGDGLPELRHQTITSDNALSGGIADQLMDVRVTVYFDDNGDDALTAGETTMSYRTKVSKLATYQALVP